MARGKDLESYIEETTDNIRKDRNINGSHHEYGIVAAKYVETLQRSNEQLVKLAALIQKNSKGDQGLTMEDKQDLFDMINGGGE